MSSGSTCAADGCYNSSKKLKTFSQTFCLQHQQVRQRCPCPPPYALHTMPVNKDRRTAWLAALKLQRPPKRVYVCSYHFVNKRPSVLHPDPELYLGYDRPPRPKRRRKPVRTQAADSGGNTASAEGTQMFNSVSDHADSAHPPDPQQRSVHAQREDPAQHDHDYCKTDGDDIGSSMLKNDFDAFLYTGLSLKTFHILVSTLEVYASNAFPMSVQDQVLMTLMTLKSDHLIGDLGRQFHIPQSMASKIFSYWIDRLEEVLLPLIPWLPKETIRATSPEAFKKNFPNTTCILDCSEILFQKPKVVNSSKESYSHFSSDNKVKYLVAIAPCGLIMFISPVYGGRCSDKFISMDSGILDHLKPGDEVMADRGFNIKKLLLDRGVKLVMASFTKKRCQLPEEVRVHVGRAISRLKVYKILSEVVSSTMAPKIDKILRICAALVNLRPDLIHDLN
uniref:THAP-type domain-containing protein n=1 Tax=Dicentrarchus labrax TaxID=13489 RepID=A0A8C4ESW1_DICLA